MRSSVMRDLMAITQRPEVISLAGGLPDTESFDRDVLAVLLEQIAHEEGARALQYGPTEGIGPALDAIVNVMAAEGMDVDPADLIVTTGGQQGLDLIARTFIDPGDIVLAEGPTYPGAAPCFTAARAEVRHIPLDADGLDPDLVEEAVWEARREGAHVKYLYTIPTYQNPSGCTTTLPRRKRLVELASELDLLIIEDNPYSLLRYEGEPLPTLRALDTEGRVVYVGTFSKIFSPGVRVGWLEAPAPIRARINLMKQAADLCSSTLAQLVVARFFELDGGNAWRAWVASLIGTYRERRDAMVRALREHAPPQTQFAVPEGGLFLWATLPDVIDTTDLLARALTRNVAFVPGAGAYLDGDGTHSMRLNFSAMSAERIEEGVRRIGVTIDEVLTLARSLESARSRTSHPKET
jgi:2-aminoadipate transaminase